MHYVLWRLSIFGRFKINSMKKLIGLLLLMAGTLYGQECELTVMTTEDGQEIKSTPDYMVYERVFGNTSQFIFFSLSNSGGVPLLELQVLAKGKDFPPVYCIDKNSRIFVQLDNGKILTLVSATEDQCSGLIYDSSEKNNIRILTASFFFTVGSIEELEKSPISFIRIKYATETTDYPLKSELVSEGNGKTYKPASYFINYIKCLAE
jgi:hypothetical protein